ncbi:uncharacterized protein FOMMEDRAFT_132529 [Fomitiporia mediterranea MF3/22]|uniref:uncharacterized protein n=1 Tax=Fomitiporia mediterranea (strain MF3/22) TaxID=694068 RepID=UPI0004409A8E|nr:uncharacterized protein FOMMEDRAFT_132529 [Fomitiporia mediterranea MF3/22]EJD06148.1 hypothetical protein FOMMEDRAFT_132529 [Fomitiporia mediterranea MF3/22]
MSARGHQDPVQILRSPPQTRHTELQEVDSAFDAATASPATPAVSHSLGRICFPPSPPYTNPHLRRAVPLPFFDESFSKNQPASMECGQNALKRMQHESHRSLSVLSPPYSPRRRTLSLLSVDENEEAADSFESIPPESVSSAETDGYKGRQLIGDFDESEPPPLKLKDLDLGEESDDWDEPLFLHAPSALHSSDGLELNLFGTIYSSDDDFPSHGQFNPPSSPTIHSSSLPAFDDDGDHPKSGKPLFDPSDFDVFENGWDAISNSDSTRFSTFSSDTSSQDTILSPVYERSGGFDDCTEPFLFETPTSPSRRSIIDLPGDESSDSTGLEPLMASLAIGQDEVASRLYDQSSSSHAPYSQEIRPSFDFTAEAVQTPFRCPISLHSPVSQSPSTPSLLFASLEPQDIPLPESPEEEVLTLQGDYASLHMFEEHRIRTLHREMLEAEVHARNREVALTDYIARLNAMKPPSIPAPVPIYRPRTPLEVGGSPSTLPNDDLFANSDTSQPQEQPSLSQIPTQTAYTHPCSSIHGPTALEFLQARRREVQSATAMRAAERRRRKRTKERIRELDALLQIKTGHLRPTDVWTLTASRGRRGRNDEAIVLAASGSDRHLAHTNAMLLGNAQGPMQSQRERQDEIMQLVAKMVFRRRDSSRPLSGKAMPAVREYVRSGLSRSIYFDDSDGHGHESTSNDFETVLAS